MGDISIKGKSPILNGERPEGPGDPGFKVSPTRLKKKLNGERPEGPDDPGFKVSPTRLKKKMEMEAELKKIKKNKLAKGRK